MKALLIAVIALALYVACMIIRSLLARRMSRDEFAGAVKSCIEEAYPDVRILSENDFGLKCEVCGTAVQMYLDNAYMQYLQYPKALDRIINDYVTQLVQLRLEEDITWDEAKRRLFPAVRPDACLDELRQLERGQELVESAVAFEFEAGLKTIIVLDFEQTVRTIREDELRAWQISPEEALEWAMNNLASRTGPLWEPSSDEARRTGLFRFTTMDGYDASRILLPDLYDRVSLALDCGRIAVAIPSRDALFAISSDNDRNVKQLEQTAMQVHVSSHHSVSPGIFFFPRAE